MTASLAPARSLPFSRRKPLGRIAPQSLSRQARSRFLRDRLDGYLRRIGGHPNDHQGLLIQSMIDAEWSAITCSLMAGEAGSPKEVIELMKQAAEHRRLLLLLDRDLSKTIPPPPVPEPTKPMDAIEYGKLLDARRQAASS